MAVLVNRGAKSASSSTGALQPPEGLTERNLANCKPNATSLSAAAHFLRCYAATNAHAHRVITQPYLPDEPNQREQQTAVHPTWALRHPCTGMQQVMAHRGVLQQCHCMMEDVLPAAIS
jgi:hypothetical protein